MKKLWHKQKVFCIMSESPVIPLEGSYREIEENDRFGKDIICFRSLVIVLHSKGFRQNLRILRLFICLIFMELFMGSITGF